MNIKSISNELLKVAESLTAGDYKEDFISGLKRLKFRNLDLFEDGFGQAFLSEPFSEIRVQLFDNDEKIEVEWSSLEGKDFKTFRLNQYKKALRWIAIEPEGSYL